jgi:hypothetical protein
MSGGFAVPPGPAERVRPATVTISSILLLVVAVVYAIGFVVSLTIIGEMTEIFEEEFAGTEAEGMEGVVAGAAIAGGAINLLIAIGLVVLAVLNNKGKNPSRIVTWVLGGIGLCCGGIGLLTSGLGGGSSFGTSGDVDQDRIQQRLEEALPGWYEPLTIATTVISILALGGALLLLALPPSNEFFRKPPQQFEPPPPAYPQVG